MKRTTLGLVIATTSLALNGCATTCGPGTVETDGGGWGFRFNGSINTAEKVCLPVSPVSDCTNYSMKEEDGGGWGVDRDGGGHRIDRDGGGHRVDRDGGGVRKERDEPHHPSEAGDLGDDDKVIYMPAGYCRIGVRPRTMIEETALIGRYPPAKDEERT